MKFSPYHILIHKKIFAHENHLVLILQQSRPGVGRNHSQQRRPGDSGGGQVGRGGRGPGGVKVIAIPLSAGREPKLKTVENAWKPNVLESKQLTEEQAATEEVSYI